MDTQTQNGRDQTILSLYMSAMSTSWSGSLPMSWVDSLSAVRAQVHPLLVSTQRPRYPTRIWVKVGSEESSRLLKGLSLSVVSSSLSLASVSLSPTLSFTSPILFLAS